MDVYWSKHAQDRLWHYIKATKDEIGGFGYARVDETNVVVVSDVWLAPQYASKAEVDFIDGSGVGYAIEKAANDGMLDDPQFIWVSWHSHNTMKAYWSSVDEKCISTYGEAGIDRLLSVVGNHSMEYEQRLDFFRVAHSGFEIDHVHYKDLPMLADPADPFFTQQMEWDEEIKSFVRERPKATNVNYAKNRPAGMTKYPTTTPSNAAKIAKDQYNLAKTNKLLTDDGHFEMVFATAERSVQGVKEFFFPDNVGWVNANRCGTDFQGSDGKPWTIEAEEMPDYPDEMLALGSEIASKLTSGEVSYIDDLSDGEKRALYAFYDVLSTPAQDLLALPASVDTK